MSDIVGRVINYFQPCKWLAPLRRRAADKKVRPATRAVSVSVKNNGFNYTFPAHSLTILRLRLK